MGLWILAALTGGILGGGIYRLVRLQILARHRVLKVPLTLYVLFAGLAVPLFARLFRHLAPALALSASLAMLVVLVSERRVNQRQEMLSLSLRTWLLLPGMLGLSLLLIILLGAGRGPQSGLREGEYACVLVLNFALFLLYDVLQKQARRQRENEDFKEKMLAYANELETMKESYSRLRSLRHDMKNHLQELKHLAGTAAGSVTAYVEAMEQYMTNDHEQVSSGNREVDSTLNYLLRTAAAELNAVHTHIVLPESLNLRPFVLNVIVGNLLENAIAAAKQSEQKMLAIEMRIKRGLLFIHLENSFAGSLEHDGQTLLTSKADKTRHGLGLENVKRMVAEQNGEIKIDWQDGIFRVTVMLYLDQVS